MPKLVGAIDQGTTSTRFVIFNEEGDLVTYHQVELEQHYPKPGWVEHDPFELVDSVQICIEHAVRKLVSLGYAASDIQGVGLTNQRETTIVWDSETGQPLYPALVWSDSRTSETVEQYTKHAERLEAITGLSVATYFSAVKLRWLLDNVPAVAEAKEQGRLQFGTVDTWLIYNLTGNVVTDVSNASRTLLMDLQTLSWSEEAQVIFGIEGVSLAKIASSSEVYGMLRDGVLKGRPLAGCLGDQQAALVGQQCFRPGDAKATYGTGCFMLYNTGRRPIRSKHGLLPTVAYKFGDRPASYALEGSVAVAGSSINWLRNNLGLVSSAEQVNTLAAQVPDAAGVYFVTAFGGLFAPYWRSDVRGLICGLTQYTTLQHIARATLEAVCYQARAILDAMNMDSQTPLVTLKVDGGMSNSDLCMQIQSDILGIKVDRPSMRETTALGAAMAAGVALGVWQWDDLDHLNQKERSVFVPSITEEKRQSMYSGWQEAVQRSFGPQK